MLLETEVQNLIWAKTDTKNPDLPKLKIQSMGQHKITKTIFVKIKLFICPKLYNLTLIYETINFE